MQRLADLAAPASTSASVPAPASPGGPDAVVAILRRTDAAVCKAVLRELDADAPQVAEAVRQRLTNFAELETELADVNGASLASALADMETRDIALALCAAPEPLSRRVLGCLDSARAKTVRTAMSKPGPMSLCDVEAAQESLAAAVRRAAGAGTYRPARSAEPATAMAAATVAAEGDDVWRE